ncbi:hypothetical protein [Escherichia sp. ESNIH1]|uniref:hypothetical protein n=1 Tax=Escherichia sp. ESNIH1 TaxID=1985876 RepID=UPI00112FB048|nr:hypothetical protein [Escherichia sp. ESNIH1]
MPGSGHGVVCRPGKRRATGHYYADAVTPGGTAFARPTTGATTGAVRFVGPRKRSATGHYCADGVTPGGATLARPTAGAVRFVGPVSDAPPGIIMLML